MKFKIIFKTILICVTTVACTLIGIKTLKTNFNIYEKENFKKNRPSVSRPPHSHIINQLKGTL